MKNKRMVIRLFLSYILLVIPILVISSFFFNSMINDMKKSVNQRIEKRSYDIIDQLDNYFVEYQGNALKISSMEQFSADRILPHKWSTQEGIRQLKNILLMDDFSYDVILAYGGKLYTSTGYYKSESYFRGRIGCDEDYVDLCEKMLLQEEATVLYVPGASHGYLFFHYPMKSNRVEDESVNFCIRMDKIYSQIELLLEQMPVNIMITFQNQAQTEQIYLTGNLESGLGIVDEESFRNLNDEKDRIIKATSSESLGMELRIFYDSDEAYDRVLYWKNTTELCIVVFLFFAILISYKLSSDYYQNIFRLKQSIGILSQQQKTGDFEKRKNDFDIMQMMIQNVGADIERMKVEYENACDIIRQQVARLFFYSGTMETDSVDRIFASCDIELKGPFYCVVCIAPAKEDGVLPLSIYDLLQDCLGCIASIESRNAVFILLEMPHEDILKKHRNSLAEEVVMSIPDDYKMKISFSECFENLSYASSAYLETTEICRKLLAMDGQNIGYIDILNASKEEFQNQIKDALAQRGQREDKKKTDSFSVIVEYIESNFHRYDLSLEEVAEYAGFSKVYMSRFFKEKAGCRYIDYLVKCRMEHAKKLLEETDISIKEIADRVGYNTLPGFRSKFKEYYGINASEYRKTFKENNKNKM